jgi:hypothetical protein
MSERWQHGSDDLEIAKLNANRMIAMLTDYSDKVPSVIAKCIFLNECSKRFELSDDAALQLRLAQRDIAVAIGLKTT